MVVFDGFVLFVDVLQGQVFDVVLIEWLFDDSMVVIVIKVVCMFDNLGVLIFVLMGDLFIGCVSEVDISEVICVFDVVCYEKFVCMVIFSVDFVKWFVCG